MKFSFWRVFSSLITVTLIVLAVWQLQRGELAWMVFDILLAAILLVLLTGVK